MAKSNSKDLSKPKAGAASAAASPGQQKVRLAALLLAAGALGIVMGAVAVDKLALRDRLPGVLEASALQRGDAAALQLVAAATRDAPEDLARGALADALLLADFGGGPDQLARLQTLKAEPAPARAAPEVLYARALFARTGAADATLDDDLHGPAASDERGPHVALRLARAVRLLDDGKHDEGWQEIQAAALTPGAPAYALSAAARTALARGEPLDAGAFARRGLELAPGHGMLLALNVLASAMGASGEGAGEEPRRAVGPSDDETRAQKQLDTLSPRDAAVLAWALQAVSLARGDATQAQAHAKRVLAEAATSAALAARQAELFLLAGEVAAAEELVSAALGRDATNPDLLVTRARVRAMKVVAGGELQSAKRPGSIDGDGLTLPLGRLLPLASAPDLPLRVRLDPSAAPEARLQAELAQGSGGLEARLGVVEQVWSSERALLRGDIPAATQAAAAARAQAPTNTDALLADASARLLTGDREGVRAALRAAVEADQSPFVLLSAARVSYDADDFAGARANLTELARLGYQSPAALALGAMLDAKEGNARGAQATIKTAEAISQDDIDVVRARLVIARLGANLTEVRRQADRLLALDDARSPDPLLRAWQGEALFRKGDAKRAESVLQSVVVARPRLIDAHLAMGVTLAETRPMDAAASFEQVIQLGGEQALVAEATRRRAKIRDAPPLTNPPRGK